MVLTNCVRKERAMEIKELMKQIKDQDGTLSNLGEPLMREKCLNENQYKPVENRNQKHQNA